MLRRVIAAVLLVTLVILAAPCASAATPHRPAHLCCAPTFSASSMDCCHSAAPHPAIAQAASQAAEAIVPRASSILPGSSGMDASDFPISRIGQPSKPLPATILRT